MDVDQLFLVLGFCGMNVLDLYREDNFQPVRAGNEWQGPCPGCGGNDRFCVREEGNHKDGETRGWYHCGHGHGGNGCGKTGDTIQYLRDFRGMTFRQACDYLGITPDDKESDHHRYRPVSRPKRNKVEQHKPKAWDYPAEVVDAAMWREHGMKFVDKCHEILLGRQKSLDWLAGRGIPFAMVEKYKIGLHLGKTRGDQEWEPDFRPWKSWGLRDEKADGGKPRMFVLPAGIVVPWIRNGELRRIRIRLAKPNPKNPKEKYHVVKGSSIDLFSTTIKARAFVLVETELDAVMIDSEAGDLVGAIGLGAVGMMPDKVTDPALRQAVRILNALDFDEAGLKSSVWWEEHFKNSVRWPVPVGKDPGEAWQAGVDIRSWIEAGLPASLVRPMSPEQEQARNTRRATQQATAPTGEVAELLDLLRVSGGNIAISGNGYAMAVHLDDSWKAAHQQQSARITELVFLGLESGDYLATLPDGIYTARNLVRR